MTPPPVTVIGLVRSTYTTLEDTPIQAGLNRAEHAILEINSAYEDALDGLEGFDYAWLVTWLHHRDQQVEGPVPLRQTPFLLRGTGRKMGVLATRGPRRINPIGLSLVQILAVTGCELKFAGVDLLDGTPVIDIKPYVARFDRPPGDPACGWFDEINIADRVTPAALAVPGPEKSHSKSRRR